jgi:hypothetical protein
MSGHNTAGTFERSLHQGTSLRTSQKMAHPTQHNTTQHNTAPHHWSPASCLLSVLCPWEGTGDGDVDSDGNGNVNGKVWDYFRKWEIMCELAAWQDRRERAERLASLLHIKNGVKGTRHGRMRSPLCKCRDRWGPPLPSKSEFSGDGRW